MIHIFKKFREANSKIHNDIKRRIPTVNKETDACTTEIYSHKNLTCFIFLRRNEKYTPTLKYDMNTCTSISFY